MFKVNQAYTAIEVKFGLYRSKCGCLRIFPTFFLSVIQLK